jgi:hypothetical protein
MNKTSKNMGNELNVTNGIDIIILKKLKTTLKDSSLI